MKQSNAELRDNLLKEVSDANMSLERKMKILQLIDTAFREYMGAVYLSDEELEQNDILSRSM